MLPGPTGVLLTTIILSSGVLYEMIGPACAKASLFLSGTLQRQPRPQPHGGEAKPLPGKALKNTKPAKAVKKAAS